MCCVLTVWLLCPWAQGILYINPSDLGWSTPVSSWIDTREVQAERANLSILFDKYLPSCLDTLRTRYPCTLTACCAAEGSTLCTGQSSSAVLCCTWTCLGSSLLLRA